MSTDSSKTQFALTITSAATAGLRKVTPSSSTSSSWSYNISDSPSGSGIITPPQRNTSGFRASDYCLPSEIVDALPSANAKRVLCPECSKPFNNESNMNRHLGDKHPKQFPVGDRYRCGCGEYFRRPDVLKKHEVKTGHARLPKYGR